MMRRYFAAVDESSKVQVWSDTYCGFNGTAGEIKTSCQCFFFFSSLVHLCILFPNTTAVLEMEKLQR